jgi:hypothetical protein
MNVRRFHRWNASDPSRARIHRRISDCGGSVSGPRELEAAALWDYCNGRQFFPFGHSAALIVDHVIDESISG